MTLSVLWFRRDLRLRDHPALRAAAREGAVLPFFCLDPRLWRGAGPARRAWLAASLRALDDSLDGGLCIRYGDPAATLARIVEDVGATEVHVTNDSTPYARARDRAALEALSGLPGEVRGVATGTPYVVPPGTVTKGDGSAYKVFTPFRRAWGEQPQPRPEPAPRSVDWVRHEDDGRVAAMLEKALRESSARLPKAGEAAAHRRLAAFVDGDLGAYANQRDDPATDATSRLSPYLKLGVLHPRQILAAVADSATAQGEGASSFVSEICWREFYADVLHHHPQSAWGDLNPIAGLSYDDAEDAIEAWRTGTTGFPIVDAGMRQLEAEGWMHNRVRMITASFLTKDLHAWWPVGARHFLDRLIDGDLASNNHGWQWVAGTGTDAAPYFRVFNPITQGVKFDPTGEYVRRWIPQLRHLAGKSAHTPWEAPDGYDHDYPRRIVDHAQERLVALDRYQRGR